MGKRSTAGNPLDTPQGRAKAREAIADAGLPLNDRAANALIDKFADIVEQGSPSKISAKRVERGGMNDDGHDDVTEEQRTEHFFNPDGDGEP